MLAEHPEIRRQYRGKVRCVYIDPPFNTGQAFEHYDDWMEHSTAPAVARIRPQFAAPLLGVPAAPLLEAGVSAAEASRLTIREKLDVLEAAGFIHWPAAGGFPRLLRYLVNTKGRTVGDLWTDINVINSQAAERTSRPGSAASSSLRTDAGAGG